MRSACMSLIAVLAVMLSFGSAANAASEVVVSIKPIHSLVAGVMDGVGEPHLIVRGGDSPHTYALKPSDAKALEKAKVVFWVGEILERFLERPVETLAGKAKVVALSSAPGLTKHAFREGGPWDDHAHDEHGHGKHADEKHDHDKHGHDKHADVKHDHDKHDHDKHADEKHDHDKHGHDKHADEKHDHDKHGHDKHAHDKHAHDEVDLHIWLDPLNAKAMVSNIVSTLVEIDAGNAETYKANGRKLAGRLDALIASAEKRFAPIRKRPFVVFHDAYQYLEKRFDLNAVGSITVSPEVKPGARRVAEMKKKIGKLGAVCVFSEPQFEPKLVRVVTEGTSARTGTLDPVGSDLPDGPDLYFSLMERNVKALADCLGKTS